MNIQNIKHFFSLSSYDYRIGHLKIVLGMSSSEEKDCIVLDMLYYLLCFCQKQRFNNDQSLTLFNITSNLHKHCMQTPHLEIERDWDYFQNELLKKAIYRPPFSERVFNLRELKEINNYFLESYFRYYPLYKYVFTDKVTVDLVGNIEKKVNDMEETTKTETPNQPMEQLEVIKEQQEIKTPNNEFSIENTQKSENKIIINKSIESSTLELVTAIENKGNEDIPNRKSELIKLIDNILEPKLQALRQVMEKPKEKKK